MSPEIVFLKDKIPLAEQVAGFLLKGRTNLPLDLGDTQVWVPTAGAGRRIRAALARLASERRTGVLSPAFRQPMEALLPESVPLAMRADREAAWVAVFHNSNSETWDQLVPNADAFSDPAGSLGIGGMLCDLCDLLAEGGITPADAILVRTCPDDAGRWEQLRDLYQIYLALLRAENLADPNELRLRPSVPPGIRRVVVACISDLATAAAHYLEFLGKHQVEVGILVWNPSGLPAGWDDWGRPLTSEWSECALETGDNQIRFARQVDEEAVRTIDFLAAAEVPGDYAVALADETLGASLAAEISRRGGLPFEPQGKTLAADESAKIAVEWENFRMGGDLRVLRNLLQCPHFFRWLGGATKLYPTQLLQACDDLIVQRLAETIEQCPTSDFMDAVQRLRAEPFTKILESIASEAAQRVLEIWDEINRSSFYKRWTEGRLAAFSRSLRSENLFTGSPEGAVELSGWLETPWLEATRLAVCGCIEGKLPSSVGEHPFLPDSKRAALGITDNARRLARDSYLLSCLLVRHTSDNLCLTLSRFDADGSPVLPSRLLLRTSDKNLPGRVKRLFAIPESDSIPNSRVNAWRWSLPNFLRKTGISTISPSQCRDYLVCPTRFYWKNTLRRDLYEPDPREMDSRQFGTLIHKALEEFGRRAPDESKAGLIEKLVIEELEREALNMFGSSPTVAVRVQLEAARTRLRAFARVQAGEYESGWRILEVEKKITPATHPSIVLETLGLSAKIDRIERHAEFGLRIVDYKSSADGDDPAKSHFGKAHPDHFLPESQVTVGGKAKTWKDLQLPLYRYIAASLYPDAVIRTAYFLLPADPDATKVAALEIDDDVYSSAVLCAGEIAARMARGNFWPPQEINTRWGDGAAPLFLNGEPEKCFDESTITFLKGTL